MYFAANIKLLRKRRKKTQDEVAQELNMQRPTLSGYENLVAQPNVKVLVAFSDYYNIAIDTLIRQDLGSLSEIQLQELETGNNVFLKGTKLRVLTTSVNSKNEENIELVPEKAKAGYTSGFADPEYIKDLPVFHLPFLSKEKKYRAFQISGDSMLPIPEGAWVTGEFVVDWNTIKDKEAYIILTLDDGIVFKMVENRMKEDKSLRLISLNPLYEPYDIPVNSIKEIWRFTNYISPELPEPKAPVDELIATIFNMQDDMDAIKKKLELK